MQTMSSSYTPYQSKYFAEQILLQLSRPVWFLRSAGQSGEDIYC